MLETLRDYGTERLQETGEFGSLLQRHRNRLARTRAAPDGVQLDQFTAGVPDRAPRHRATQHPGGTAVLPDRTERDWMRSQACSARTTRTRGLGARPAVPLT